MTENTEDLESHLDPKGWTKKTLLAHLLATDPNYYCTSADRKAALVQSHHATHALVTQCAARLAELAEVMACLRHMYGCRLDDSGFAAASDEWVADHVRRHQTGDDLGGELL